MHYCYALVRLLQDVDFYMFIYSSMDMVFCYLGTMQKRIVVTSFCVQQSKLDVSRELLRGEAWWEDEAVRGRQNVGEFGQTTDVQR